jgi:hypothetical protein
MAGIARKYPMLRRSQAMWGSRRVWQPRLVFWLGAIGIGLISVLFIAEAIGRRRAEAALPQG